MDLDTRLIQEAMLNLGSDHIPIILRPIPHSSGARSFKFELTWLEVPGFVERLKNWWKEEVEEGSTSYNFAQKLKLVKQHVVKWKREEFGEVETKKVSCLEQIKKLEIKEMVDGLEDGKDAKASTEQEYQRLLRMEEIDWRQKSRISWLEEGDRNTKFFHKMASWRQSINTITRLRIASD